MKKIYSMAIIAALAVFGGCSTAVDGEGDINIAKSELSIGLPIGINRTAVDEEGKASWVEGDTFTLWAENRVGVFSLNGVDFRMMYYWHSLQSAVFTSNANAISDGTYTYYAVSPKPESVSNRKATYTIPAVQQGDSFNGAYDIMVAEPIKAEALSTEKVNSLALDFKHKTHTLKIEIAKNTFGLDISRLVLNFTTEVAGTVTVEATNATSALALANGSKTLTLNFANPINEGDTAWGIICPTHITDVQITAYATDGTESIGKTISLNKQCEEGHITPLQFTTTQINPPTLRFSIGKNNLGEAVKKWAILDQNGNTLLQWDTNSTNDYTYSFNGSITASGFKQYAGKTLVAQFESEHAIVRQDFTMPSTISSTTTTIPAIDVPYLLFEDFSCVHTAGVKDGDDDKAATDRNQGGELLDGYMHHKGWNAARYQLGVKTCIRINVRYQSFGAFYSLHHGRLDTPRLTGLKNGANVKIKVQFDAGAHVNSDFGYNGTNCTIIGVATHTDSASVINGIGIGHDQSGSLSDYGSTFFESQLNDNYGIGDFGNTFPTFTKTTSGVTNATRLVFYPNTTISSGAFETGNGECFIYIDNIRVSIAQ